MKIFLSRYINKIDKKGRVSVPANYRAILSEKNFNGIIVYPSFKNKCIEVCSMSWVEKLNTILSDLDPYSEERDAFETVILSEAIHLQFDHEGRVIIPEYLMNQVSITNQACFVGKGNVFEIWNPENFNKHLILARKVAQNSKLLLKNTAKNSC